MIATKEKVLLTKEQETLLIPLFSKAQDNPIIQDEKACEVLQHLEYDFQQLKVPEKTAVMMRMRAKQFDIYAREFIAAHPDALILHLGCGLDSRCLRVPADDAIWFDLDLPDVIALRRKFYSESDKYRMIASSVTDLTWLDQDFPQGRSVLVIAEGLFMYVHEVELRALVACLHQKFPGCSLVFDAFSKMTADRVQAHPSLNKTGAAIHWGIDDPHELEPWAGNIRFKEEWFFSQSPDIKLLPPFYRIMYRLTSSIQIVQRAHRLLYFTL
jgi:O-methyltransferase involved in polyketide biosynthesis